MLFSLFSLQKTCSQKSNLNSLQWICGGGGSIHWCQPPPGALRANTTTGVCVCGCGDPKGRGIQSNQRESQSITITIIIIIVSRSGAGAGGGDGLDQMIEWSVGGLRDEERSGGKRLTAESRAPFLPHTALLCKSRARCSGSFPPSLAPCLAQTPRAPWASWAPR